MTRAFMCPERSNRSQMITLFLMSGTSQPTPPRAKNWQVLDFGSGAPEEAEMFPFFLRPISQDIARAQEEGLPFKEESCARSGADQCLVAWLWRCSFGETWVYVNRASGLLLLLQDQSPAVPLSLIRQTDFQS